MDTLPGLLGFHTLRRNVQVRLGCKTLRLPGTRRKRLRCAWHAHLHSLVTSIHEISGLEKQRGGLIMKKTLVHLLFLFILGGPVCIGPAFAEQANQADECGKYSDAFDTYNIEHWQEVLLYSKAQGTVTVENGQLVLNTPRNEPIEIQIYSLFTFSGDFDIQTDFDLSTVEPKKHCRFNGGVVMQTLGDERSYKCYVAHVPQKGLFFRSRLDRFGEQNLEKQKLHTAPQRGTIRVVRKDGRITFLALESQQWRPIYVFQKPCTEKLRMRFKLQTGEDGSREPCPTIMKFDNFTVNSCNAILVE
jgi:hypothetical protein